MLAREAGALSKVGLQSNNLCRILRVARAQVIYNGRRWSVERRYSEFDMLDKELQRMWAFDPSVRLGELPSKVLTCVGVGVTVVMSWSGRAGWLVRGHGPGHEGMGS